MSDIDIGGARPVEASQIGEVYMGGASGPFVVLYNERTGKATDRNLKTMEAWQLVELLGGTDTFASYVLDADRGAVGWLRRSLIRGVVEGIPVKDSRPWSIVQMVYHLPIADPYRVIGDGAPDGAFYTPLTVAETWELLNARGAVIRPTRPVKPPRPVLDAERLRRALKDKKVLVGVTE